MRSLLIIAMLGSFMAQAASAKPLKQVDKEDFATDLFRKIQLYGG